MRKPRIGLLPTGHKIYWSQFPTLKKRGEAMYQVLVQKLESYGDVIAPPLVDTPEKAEEAALFFKQNPVDIVLIFPFGYTTGSCVVAAVKDLTVPLRIINAHEDASYDYLHGDTEDFLHHEGPCCVPEYAGALVYLGSKFKVITGWFGDGDFWAELSNDIKGTCAAAVFKTLRFGVIGQSYLDMVDMPIDEHRILKSTGHLLSRPEVEEIEEAYMAATPEQIQDMIAELREMYDVEENVTNQHLEESAKICVAYDRVINQYNISAFGYYWWGQKKLITELRSQSALAVSRLAALGRPGVTEGDVKTAMGMKIMDLIGAGGMFLEFFSFDFIENFILVGHDGPSNINVASSKPKIKQLEVHHGKTGAGIGIDFDMATGPCTILNFTQFGTDKGFKMIYTVGEVVSGDILHIGNPNCRVKVEKPLKQFMNDWCQQGPVHHMALGLGDQSAVLEAFAEAMNFEIVRI